MPDIQFIQFNDTLELTKAREVPGADPRMLELQGKDFRSAVEVYINDDKVSFVIASNTTILAEVPETLKNASVTSISILSSEFTATTQSKIQFLLGTTPKSCTGLRSMIQVFLRTLFTTLGTDAFAPYSGGSGMSILGEHTSVQQPQGLTQDFAIAIRRTEQQILATQATQSGIPDDERLLSATLLHLKFDPQLGAILARVELISQDGTQAIANLEL